MTLRPLYDAVLVEPLDVEGFVESAGKVLVQRRHWEVRHARVVAVGGGHVRKKAADLVPLSVVVGDVIVHQNMAGQEVEIDGRKLRMLREADILCHWDGPVPNAVT